MSALDEAAARMTAAVPGAALALRAPGTDRTAAAGHRVPGGAPMTASEHLDLASVTKAVTTAALMRLASAGLVALDEPVRRFTPDFSGGAKDGVTVRDLLLHRGGLWEWHPLYLAADSRRDALRHAARLPLRHPPRTGRHYSDLGFMLLGEVVAAAAGAPLQDAVADLVTGPLGMDATRYARPAGPGALPSARGDAVEIAMIDSGEPYPVPYRSGGFTRWRRHLLEGEVDDGNAFHALEGVSGHAGLFSTLADLLRFAGALARHEEHDALWHPRVAAEFFAPGPDAGQSPGFRRYDLALGGARLPLLGHPGFTGCAVGFVPGRGIALALATNRLLAAGAPAATEALWSDARAAAAEELTHQSAPPQRRP